MILLEDFWDCPTCYAKTNVPDGKFHPLRHGSDLYDIELCDQCLKKQEIKEVKRQMGVVLMCGWNYYGTYLRNEIIKPLMNAALPNLLAVSASLELK